MERISCSFRTIKVEKSARLLENEVCVCVFLEKNVLAKFTGDVNHFLSL